MQLWNNFAAKHPAAAKWVREGGLFVIVSNLVTVFKYLLLQFLPAAFSSLPVVDFGWPGIPVTLFGETFQWNILGYDSAHGGLPSARRSRTTCRIRPQGMGIRHQKRCRNHGPARSAISRTIQVVFRYHSVRDTDQFRSAARDTVII